MATAVCPRNGCSHATEEEEELELAVSCLLSFVSQDTASASVFVVNNCDCECERCDCDCDCDASVCGRPCGGGWLHSPAMATAVCPRNGCSHATEEEEELELAVSCLLSFVSQILQAHPSSS
jgi:hypothetical protein